MGQDIKPFELKDCALIAIATGKRAQNLRELISGMQEIDLNSIYYHFWGGLLRPRFDNPEYHNDFAIWIAHSLYNKPLAEKLALFDPAGYSSMSELRDEMVDIIEEDLDETEYPVWARRDNQFEFIGSQLVVFNTNMAINDPVEMSNYISRMSAGSIFFHFIDGRRRNSEQLDDFRNWLLQYEDHYIDLIERIEVIDPYFSSLTELRSTLTEAFSSYFREKSSG
ncbi:MAG: hypothetical protein JXL81_11445 [Deltaproteobacteria bacterium]|nr:hypothetical protein [Deltaproteobacteria bacterium]